MNAGPEESVDELTQENTDREPALHSCSFIFRLWVEEVSHEEDSVAWSGQITHVPSGVRQYIKDLDEILIFIIPYLEDLGVTISKWLHLRQRIHQLKQLFARNP